MNDLRLAVRTLFRSRGLAALAILTLALGIGANTAIFSVIDAVLLRSTPYPDADRLVRIHERGQIGQMSVSPANFRDWQRATTSFERMSLFESDWQFTVGSIDPPVRAVGALVNADFFPMLGASAELGRAFSKNDDATSAAPVVILSHGFWQQQFGGDPKIVGRPLKIVTAEFQDVRERVYTVVGVMPATLDAPEHTQFWIPAGLFYDAWSKIPRSVHFVEAIGEMKPGVTIAQASSDLNSIANRLAREYPKYNEGFSVELTDLHEDVVGRVRPALMALLAGVGFVLLIACANVANLLLTRALQRRKDLAVRLALGASRSRVIRQLVSESVILALAGATLGIAFAAWSIDFLTRMVEESLPHARFIHLNLPVLLLTLAAALVTGVLAGLAPVWQSFKTDLIPALKDTGRSTTGGVERQRMRSALVASEIALSFVLLIGAGLMLRTFTGLAAVNLGIRPDHVLTMQISLPNTKYDLDPLLRRIRQVPGVEYAAVASPLPLTLGGWEDIFVQPGEPKRTMADVSWSHFTAVSPEYFKAMGIPLLAGRLLDERDGTKGREAAVVDEMFVKRYWPHENPLGKRIKNDFDAGSSEPWTQVVGVVGHVKTSGPEQTSPRDPLAEAYFPSKQLRFASWDVVARTTGDPGRMTAAIENAIRSIDRGLPISDIQTMNQRVALSLQYRRFSMLLLAIFAGIGVTLAMVGVYGVMAYSVTQRLHEIGVRVALGAGRTDVIKLLLSSAVKQTGMGLALGFVLSLIVSRWLGGVIFGVSPTDPATFAAVFALLGMTALAAGFVPAIRATRVDPATSLREE